LCKILGVDFKEEYFLTKSSTVFIIGQDIDVKEGGETEPTEVGQNDKPRVPNVNIHHFEVNKGQPYDNKHYHCDDDGD